MSDTEAFAIVTAARQLLNEIDARRRQRKDTPTSARTIENYQKKCDLIAREMEEVDPGSPNRLLEVMIRHARSKQTFYALKSALRWQAQERIRKTLKAQDQLQRLARLTPAWKQAVYELQEATLALGQIDALDHAFCFLMLDQPARASRSKRKILPRLDDGWRARFLAINATSHTYRLVGVLLVHCGMRPEELERGVRVRYTPRGIRVLIPGAKVRATAGQPWRTFLLDEQQLPNWFVEELQHSRRMVIRAEPDALRAHLNRLSQLVLNPKGHERCQQLRLSAYVFRHALVTDLRDSGWDAQDIAGTIGESSAQTQRLYGTRRHRGSRPKKTYEGLPVAIRKESVRTAREIKPLDKSGLKQFAGQQFAGHQMAGRQHAAPGRLARR